ncbi:ABC transporter ATP-binding protein [Candidatus Microthrix parvicella]|uniref:ABC transporter ATP-binding protein n=1 Tax=Candidatus Neomicrothrix parvicella TaxID=41950 RepID=UPI0012FD98C8|nr:ABC transporter ATP-binding protein [Candidatus Microthrix parvicella]
MENFLPDRSGFKVAAVGGLSFVGGLAESTVLVLLTLTADGLIRNADTVQIIGVALARRNAVLLALVMVAIRIVTIMGSAVVSARFTAEVTAIAQHKVMARYLEGSYVARSSRPPGDMNAVVTGHAQLTGGLANGFTVVAASVCGLLAFGGASLIVNPIATLGIAVIGLIVLGLMRPLRARSRAYARELADSTRLLGQEVSEIELLHREIELFQVAERALGRVNLQITSFTDSIRRIRILSTATPQLFQTAMLAAAVISLLLIVESVDGARLASVGAVVLLLIRSMSAAQQYVTANQRVIDNAAYAQSVSELINTLSVNPNAFGNERPASMTPIRLDQLCFNYGDDSNVLTNIQIELQEGQLVGVVGPSGAGKSTLVELLLRLREPTNGRILGGSTEWQSIDPGEFAKRVAFVPQQSVLIAGTVAENVDLFRGLPHDRIVQAIKEAHLEKEISELPDGINTRLGTDGRALSGGQRQRLTIARALAGDPEVLILDEPTSALDALSEAAIRQTLEVLPAGRLVIVVAHRFSTLRSCNRIVALNEGRIEIDASPEEVLEKSDFFRAMVNDGVRNP